MFWLKSCPRCGGDLYVDRTNDLSRRLLSHSDTGMEWVSCLQCGCELYVKAGRVLGHALATAPAQR